MNEFDINPTDDGQWCWYVLMDDGRKVEGIAQSRVLAETAVARNLQARAA